MKSTITKFVLLITLLYFISISSVFSQPTIQWMKFLGGSGPEYSHSLIETTDGGYAISGQTGSKDGDISGNHDVGGAWIMYEGWVAKLNSLGELQWQKCLGGNKSDKLYSITQTKDEGYIVAGEVASNDGDVTGNHGTFIDIWVVKLTSLGEIEWQKCLGGNLDDFANQLIQTNDGGFIVVGRVNSTDGDVSGNHGQWDGWIVKLSESGEIEWQKCFGGTGDEDIQKIIKTNDNGFIISGSTSSNDGDVTGNHGLSDGWVVKLSQSGEIQWKKCIGGTKTDLIHSIIQSSDGGYVFSGSTKSNDGDINGNHGNSDCMIVKLDATGQIQWQKCFGGSLYDDAQSIAKTKDNGYIITGDIESNDGDVVGLHGLTDGWVLKLNNEGQIQWQKCLGGKDEDWTTSIIESKNGGFVVSGYSQSNDGDAITRLKRDGDIWVVKLNPFTDVEEKTSETIFEISPNPASYFIEISGINPMLKHGVEYSNIKIYNVLGEIQTTPNPTPALPASREGVRIDVSSFPPGMYFVRIGDRVSKFIKL